VPQGKLDANHNGAEIGRADEALCETR